MTPGLSFAITLGLSVFSALILTPIASEIGNRVGLVDKPRPNELQKKPATRTGGYAVLSAFLLTIGVSLVLVNRDPSEIQRIAGLVVAALLILPIAVIDDWRRLGPRPQLIGQIAVATVVMAFGVRIDNVANPFGGLIQFPLVVAVPFTLVWIVGMINTMNFIDTMDGLASGIAAIAALVLFARSVTEGQMTIALLPLTLFGACLGFLWFNFHPARVFLGTSGSMFLGFTLSVLAIIGGAKIATAAMVLGLPIIDVALVIFLRRSQGRSVFIGGDGAHLPHRLIARGFSQRVIALFIYAVCAIGGMLSLVLTGVEKLYVLLVVVAIVAAVAARLRPASHQS